MKQYDVEILDDAINELEGFVDYIAEDFVMNALNWYERVKKAIFTLNKMPERHPIADENPAFSFEARCLLVENYRILYRIMGDTVEVLHVKHPRMNR